MNGTWRIIPIFLLFMLATISASAALVEDCPNVMSFSPEDRLNGPVKTFKEQLVDISHGKSGAIKEVPRNVSYAAKYDPDGNMVEEILYRNSGVGYKHLYTYDPSGYLQTADEFGHSDTRTGKVVYEYDEAERTVTHSRWDSMNQLRTKTVDRYDERGHVIERSRYYSKGERYSHNVYRFDSNGHLVERKQTGQYGDELVECTYDPDGRLTRSRFQRKVGSKVVTANEKRYAYGEDRVTETACTGRKLSKCHKSAVLSRTARGEKKFIGFDERGSASLTAFLTEDGLLARLDSTPSPMLPCRTLIFEYENDEFGNWIKKVTLCRKAGAKGSDLVTEEVVYRDITYHDKSSKRNIPTKKTAVRTIPVVDVDSLGRPIRLPKAPRP